MNYQYIGKSTPVNNSRAKASGLLRYAGDMKLPNMLHMKLVLSPVSHGIVKAIDSSAALATPGVAAVLSFENTPDTKYNRGRVRAREDAHLNVKRAAQRRTQHRDLHAPEIIVQLLELRGRHVPRLHLHIALHAVRVDDLTDLDIFRARARLRRGLRVHSGAHAGRALRNDRPPHYPLVK